MKPFAVVSFPQENNNVSIVCASWLFFERGMYNCWWPPYKVQTKFVKAVKEIETVGVNWTVHPVNLVQKCRTYEKATRVLEKYKFKSDFENSTSEADNNTSQFHTLKRKEVCDDIDEDMDNPPAVPVSAAEGALTNNSPAVSGVSTTSCSTCFHLEENLNSMGKKMENMEKKLETLKHMMEQQSILLQKHTQRIEIETDSNFQFKEADTYEELCCLNEKLANDEEFALLASKLGVLGGRDSAEITRRILSHLIANKLAVQLNWIGGKQKRSIQDFPNVLHLVTASVRRNRCCKEILQSQVEDYLKRWLRYAPDRDGGRLKRQKRTLSDQSIL